MPRGHLDYGQGQATSVISTVSDLSEIPPRLFSPYTMHRGGNVIWMDDFSNGNCKWTAHATGTGAAITEVATDTYNGPKACSIKTPSDGDSTAYIEKGFAFPPTDAIGIEAIIQQWTDTDGFFVWIREYDGTAYHAFGISAWDTLDGIYLLSSDATYKLAKSMTINTQNQPYYMHLKMVIDVNNHLYKRIFVNGESVPLPFATGPTGASTTPRSIWMKIMHTGRAGHNDIIYVGEAAISINEP